MAVFCKCVPVSRWRLYGAKSGRRGEKLPKRGAAGVQGATRRARESTAAAIFATT